MKQNEHKHIRSNDELAQSVSSVAQLTFSGHFGGRENVAFSLAESLAPQLSSSILYLVFESRTGAHARKILLQRLQHYTVRFRLFETERRFSVRTIKELHAALVEDHVQIIHCHCYKSALYASVLKYIFRSPVRIVFTLHGLHIPFTFRAGIIHGINYLSLFAVDSIVGCSSEIVRNHLSTPFIGRKITVIKNALLRNDLSSSAPPARDTIRHELSAAHGLDPSALWVGCVGRLTHQKNFPLFIRAAAVLRTSMIADMRVQFLIAGDGELRDELRSLAHSLGQDGSVFFLGYLSEVDDFYRAIDILALTSDWEGTPMCILEGMSHGLPIVASAAGGVVEMITHEVNGLLFPAGDLSSLVANLAELIGNAAKRRSLGAAGRQHVLADFSSERWAQRHVELYRSLLAQGVDA